jgi:hypothetical protein
MATIYGIFNIKNKKIYIGATTRCTKTRLVEHFSSAKKGKIKSDFYHDLANGNRKDFMLYNIESCSNEKRFEREMHWISELRKFKKIYNSNDGGRGANNIKRDRSVVDRIKETRQKKLGPFYILNKKTNEVSGPYFDRQKCAAQIGLDHSYFCKILNKKRTSPQFDIYYQGVGYLSI